MNFLSKVLSSCRGFRSYASLLDVPYRSTLIYLAQLVALLMTIVLASSLPHLLSRVETAAQFVDREFPRFQIRDGVVTLSAAQGTAAKKSNPRIVLDLGEKEAGGSAEESVGAGTEATATQAAPISPDVIIRRDGISIRRDCAEALYLWFFATDQVEWPKRAASASAVSPMKQIQFSDYGMRLPDGEFTGEYVRSSFRSGLLLGVPFALLLMVVGGFVVCLLQAMLFSYFYSAMEQQLSARLTRRQLLNLATYSITPAAIIVTVYNAFHLDGLPMIYMIAYGIFLFGSTNACRPRREEAAVDDSEFY